MTKQIHNWPHAPQPPNRVDPSPQSLFTDLTQMNFYAAQFWKLMEDGHAQTISQTQSNELYFLQKRIFLPPSLRYFSMLWAKSPLLWQVEGNICKDEIMTYWLRICSMGRKYLNYELFVGPCVDLNFCS